MICKPESEIQWLKATVSFFKSQSSATFSLIPCNRFIETNETNSIFKGHSIEDHVASFNFGEGNVSFTTRKTYI